MTRCRRGPHVTIRSVPSPMSEDQIISEAAEPPVEVARVVCWLNRWGSLDQYRARAKPAKLSREWVDGYEAACMDAMSRLKPCAPEWLKTWRDEAWGNPPGSESGGSQ